jgi:bifunctional UDP-N-acetylglucosamine pyrophosphorylase/glucosamine-1-phosphate N-acetyltransferase
MDLLAGKITDLSFDRSRDADIATAAAVDSRSIVGEGCLIKPNVQITNSVLGPGVHVEEKSSIVNSVIWSHTRISSFAEIEGSVIARSCHIGRNVKITNGTVLGDKASVPDYSQI